MTTRRLALTTALGVILIAAVAGVTLAFVLPARGGPHEVELQGVNGDDLVGWVRMLRPDNRSPSISADAAIAEAATDKTGAKVLETVLMRLVNESAKPPLDRLAWAVNFDPATVQAVPPSGPAGAKFPRVCDLHPEYDVVWIDAQTGEFIFETQYTATLPEDDPSATCPAKDYPEPTPVPGQPTGAR